MAHHLPTAFAAAQAALDRGPQSTMGSECTTNVLGHAMLIGSDDLRAAVRQRFAAKTKS
jgi:hypothetical protein